MYREFISKTLSNAAIQQDLAEMEDFIEYDVAPYGCWEWNGHLKNGYGVKMIEGYPRGVHNIMYQVYVGPVKEDYVVHHLCENRRCCNPKHLDQVSKYNNWFLGKSTGALAIREGKCKRGHTFTSENTYINPSGKRVCKKCRAAWNRQDQAAQNRK